MALDLIEAGADPDARDSERDRTALCWAETNGYAATANHLRPLTSDDRCAPFFHAATAGQGSYDDDDEGWFANTGNEVHFSFIGLAGANLVSPTEAHHVDYNEGTRQDFQQRGSGVPVEVPGIYGGFSRGPWKFELAGSYNPGGRFTARDRNLNTAWSNTYSVTYSVNNYLNFYRKSGVTLYAGLGLGVKDYDTVRTGHEGIAMNEHDPFSSARPFYLQVFAGATIDVLTSSPSYFRRTQGGLRLKLGVTYTKEKMMDSHGETLLFDDRITGSFGFELFQRTRSR